MKESPLAARAFRGSVHGTFYGYAGMGMETVLQGGDGLGTKTLYRNHMKYKSKLSLVLCLVLTLSGLAVHAQIYDRTVIHQDDNIYDRITYRFLAFSEGTVYMKNGSRETYKMNFNKLFCVMQFIDSKGDTLNVSRPEQFDSIRLIRSLFYYDKGY